MTCHKRGDKETAIENRRLLVSNPLLRWFLWFCLGISVLVLSLSTFTWLQFRDLPGPSPLYDCDDAVVAMWQRFSELGVKATPIVGNLKMTGEAYPQINHVWLMVTIAGINIPFDWGQPWFDSQHYEGYTISREKLIEFVQQDIGSPAGQGAVTGTP